MCVNICNIHALTHTYRYILTYISILYTPIYMCTYIYMYVRIYVYAIFSTEDVGVFGHNTVCA